MLDDARLATANAACQLFIPETRLQARKGRVWCLWTDWRGKESAAPWATRGNDFYPVWHRRWGHGGTCCTALSQLVRFVQGRPVLPLSTWGYWCSDEVALARHRGADHAAVLLRTLADGGYPEFATCVLCGKSPIGRFDWFNNGKVSGPGCWYTAECKAKQRELAGAKLENLPC